MGRELESMYEAVSPNRHVMYRTAFLKGIVSGVGGVIGATIVIALIIWILSVAGRVPLIGPFVDAVKHTLQRPTVK